MQVIVGVDNTKQAAGSPAPLGGAPGAPGGGGRR